MAKKLSELGKVGELKANMKSDSSDEVYEIRQIEDKLTCTCLGYMTSKKRPRYCKHIRRYQIKYLFEEWFKEKFLDKDKIIIRVDEILDKVLEIEKLFEKGV